MYVKEYQIFASLCLFLTKCVINLTIPFTKNQNLSKIDNSGFDLQNLFVGAYASHSSWLDIMLELNKAT